MTSNSTTRTYKLDCTAIIPGNNDRTLFNQAELQALSENIAANGLLQPIMVRPLSEGQYQIILGERRFRAIRLLGWETIPAIIRDVTEEEASAGMLSENMVRANLDPIDEAHAYQSRIDAYGWSIDTLAQVAGVSTVRVLFRLKLLKLREDLQALVRSDNLPIGYAQILADGELDNNGQAQAVDALRDNATPTPAWFRREVGTIKARQAQVDAFDDGSVFATAELSTQPGGVYPSAPVGCAALPVRTSNPATPGLNAAPKIGETIREVIENQIGFWLSAAQGWDNRGKNFKRAECDAAVYALRCVLDSI